MESAVSYYKDAKTGKIYMHIGGREPIEIDDMFVRINNLDVNSIKIINADNPPAEQKVICPNCGTAVKKAHFCSECGNKLD